MNRDKLKNLTLNITDGEHGSIIDSLNSSYYLLSNKNIKNGKINITNDDRKISIDSFNKIRKRTKLSNNDVVVASVGTIGKTAIIKSNNINFDFQRSVAIIKPNQSKITSDYLYYFFNVPYVKKQLQNKANGAVQKCLYINDFENLDIDYHDILTQQKITSILSIFDEKMELNNKINKELEKIAKTLYDYWFVQFDFPNEKGKPYKSSGGKMVWNEELKKDIPIGWRSDLLKNRLKSYLGGTPRRNNEEYWNNGSIPWLSSGEVAEFPILSSAEKITDSGLKNSAAKLLRVGSLMISITGNIRVSILGMDASANQSVVGIEENEELKKSYLYLFILNHISQYEALMTGAVQKHINKEVIDKTLLLIPSKEVLNMYYKLADSLFEKIIKISKENKELSELRDFLLPMLMNGQVKIS